MSRDTYLSYKGYKWLWICSAAVAFMWLIYGWHDPIGGPSGGSWLGYTYGVIATAGILFLMYYGIRKRSFYAKRTTLKGTLAAHVWIGVALILVVPLHSGFSFGWNVHTLAYVLMVIVIASGIWGVVMYAEQPAELRSQRGGGTPKQLLGQIRSLSEEIEELIGGTTETSLMSDSFLKMLTSIDFMFEPSLKRALAGRNPKQIDRKQIAKLVAKLPKDEQETGLKLVGLVNKKRELVCRLQEEARAQTWVRLWLYIHLPISFALMAAVIIHILSVFYYW